MSTLCDPMECSSPGSSVHGISQARIPEWVIISFSNIKDASNKATKKFYMKDISFKSHLPEFYSGYIYLALC